MFVFGLTVSAIFAPEWRVLHVLQALIYAAVIVLTRRKSAWGFGAGLAVALFWNALLVFATPAARDGIEELWTVVATGHVERPDLLLSLFAASGHVLLIIACVLGFLCVRPTARQWGQLVGGGALALAYLFAIVFAVGPPQAVDLMKGVLGW
jgi:hypothetical protein